MAVAVFRAALGRAKYVGEKLGRAEAVVRLDAKWVLGALSSVWAHKLSGSHQQCQLPAP